MRGTGPYPEETFEQREERLRLEDERDSYRVKQVIEDRDAEGGRMDKYTYEITLTLHELDMASAEDLDMMSNALVTIQKLGIGDVEAILWKGSDMELRIVEP